MPRMTRREAIAAAAAIGARERKDPSDRLGFVLHLGDFVYEVVWYPARARVGR